MGTWGPGYFENDAAADFLLDLKEGGASVLFETMADLRDDPMTPELCAKDDFSAAYRHNIGDLAQRAGRVS
ncbi:DUF4259 domain-containing protein [Pseudooceanicola sp. MF1-13]|uniref:DUF4259 domain-containing protein n=1 Tax=Pseudooceanicola sp. MF1-13 TaxID=3379095 RepID=UPI003892C33E